MTLPPGFQNLSLTQFRDAFGLAGRFAVPLLGQASVTLGDDFQGRHMIDSARPGDFRRFFRRFQSFQFAGLVRCVLIRPVAQRRRAWAIWLLRCRVAFGRRIGGFGWFCGFRGRWEPNTCL
jgi:hypothetical protein